MNVRSTLNTLTRYMPARFRQGLAALASMWFGEGEGRRLGSFLSQMSTQTAINRLAAFWLATRIVYYQSGGVSDWDMPPIDSDTWNQWALPVNQAMIALKSGSGPWAEVFQAMEEGGMVLTVNTSFDAWLLESRYDGTDVADLPAAAFLEFIADETEVELAGGGGD